MHPPFSGLLSAVAKAGGITEPDQLNFDNPSSLIAGEDLLDRIYRAVRDSSSTTGSNFLNTTLLVTFDEHGGTYDHVPPPAAVPPDGSGPGQFGFNFDRSGVRIPTVAISAWIPERTVVTDEYRSTSLLSTMRERWDLGAPLTARDADARSFAGVSSLTVPRPQENWPDVVARPVPVLPPSAQSLDAQLGLLGMSLVQAVLGLGAGLGASVPSLDPRAPLTGTDALALAHDVLGDVFPAMRS